MNSKAKRAVKVFVVLVASVLVLGGLFLVAAKRDPAPVITEYPEGSLGSKFLGIEEDGRYLIITCFQFKGEPTTRCWDMRIHPDDDVGPPIDIN